MNEKNTGRRKLIKSIALGSGTTLAGKSLPQGWSKPVVDAIMLPAHAQTTDDTSTQSRLATTPMPTTPVPTPTPTAPAPGCCNIEGTYCTPSLSWNDYATSVFVEIQVTTEGSITLDIWFTQFQRTYSASANVGCAGGSFDATATSSALRAAAQIAQKLPAAPDSISVTAQVVCDSTTIHGTITANDGSGNTLGFSASVNGCPG